MGKRLVLGLFAAALLAASCASPPAFPARRTSDDCLVLVRSTIVNEDKVNNIRRYYILLNDGSAEIKVPEKTEGIIVITVREAGTRIIRLRSDVNTQKGSGNDFSDALSLKLPYKPGKVLLADFAFLQELKQTGANTATSRYAFPKATEEDNKALVTYFRSLGVEDWQLE